MDFVDVTTELVPAPAAIPGRASLSTLKTVDKFIAYPGDSITYHLAITNNGSLSADNVVITDPAPSGTTFIPGSLTVSVPYSGSPTTAITLSGSIASGQTVSIAFRVLVGPSPNPNPVHNVAAVSYTYTVEPQIVVTVTSSSNGVNTTIFQNNYSQQINDLIESIALEEAALAAVLNAEGAKIQRFVSIPGVTTDMLLCLNQSVSEMTDSIAILQSILKQKLCTVGCQISGKCQC